MIVVSSVARLSIAHRRRLHGQFGRQTTAMGSSYGRGVPVGVFAAGGATVGGGGVFAAGGAAVGNDGVPVGVVLTAAGVAAGVATGSAAVPVSVSVVVISGVGGGVAVGVL